MMSFHKYSRIDSLEVQIAALNFRVELLEESLGIQSPKPMVKTAPRVASAKRTTRQVPGPAGHPLRPDAPLYIPSSVQSKDSSAMKERPTAKEPPTPKKSPATKRPRDIRSTLALPGTRATQRTRNSQRTRVPKRTRGPRKTPGPKATQTIAEKPVPAEKSAPEEKPAAQPAAPKPIIQSIPQQATAKKALPNRPEREHFAFIQTLQRVGENKEEIFTRAMEEFPDLCKGQGLSEKARTTAVRNTVEIYTSSWAERYD